MSGTNDPSGNTFQHKQVGPPNPSDAALWTRIRHATGKLGYDRYNRFIETGMQAHAAGPNEMATVGRPPDVNAYQSLKRATEAFMKVHCATWNGDAQGVTPGRAYLLELIWSYWHERTMIVEALDAIATRFRNVGTPHGRDPLAAIEIDPLRPLNNLLWGYIEDEPNRLTVARRAYEYDHHYGLALVPAGTPRRKAGSGPTAFLETFHDLLRRCAAFYRHHHDGATDDGFGVVGPLPDIHLALSQGEHNRFGDLACTARQEMMMRQWLLARPEMGACLPDHPTIEYPEPWMDRVEVIARLIGRAPTPVRAFRDLGVFGERLVLSIRLKQASEATTGEQAANWARFWRSEIEGYIHAYRAVTGVDLEEE